MHTHSYLALGDSYTIGETLPLYQSFPYQAVQQLRQKGHNFTAPEIVARTGWTTAELEQAMDGYPFLSKYDFVSLLIGVNNQYRGQEVMVYKQGFEELLKKAIALTNGKKEHVLVLSIPDYGVTPHAKDLDPEKIGREIEVLNSISKLISIQYKVNYVDIMPDSRLAADQPELLAEDGLHPSAAAYAQWAQLVTEAMAAQLK
jgi:lysophospholipase L1-like esterase